MVTIDSDGTVDSGIPWRTPAGHTYITIEQSFSLYGLFVDYTTGSNTPRGTSGDLGRDLADTVSKPSRATFPSASLLKNSSH